MKQLFFILFSIFWSNSFAFGDQKMTPQEYINSYKDEAIKEMKRTGVPASITLAQGMLESSYGNSHLAVKANNHFGIKCHSDWTGPKVYKDDDSKNECFRKYKHVLDSYKDHSDFLKNRSRYAFLFELKPTDYKGWAKGLKKAGYATNPKYPSLLIDLIERYDLHLFDSEAKSKESKEKQNRSNNNSNNDELSVEIQSRILVSANYVKYIVVKKGDTFESIEQETGVRKKRLLRYNERKNASILEGEKLYLQPKKKSAKTKYYTVQKGETLYGISQEFAVSMKSIIKRNRLYGKDLQIGQQLKLRGRKIKL